jgi:hypothetical protein
MWGVQIAKKVQAAFLIVNVLVVANVRDIA